MQQARNESGLDDCPVRLSIRFEERRNRSRSGLRQTTLAYREHCDLTLISFAAEPFYVS
jgi:hypothetical protein